MLRQRVLTALVLAPLVLWAVLALPSAGFALLIGSIVGLAAWEWSRLAGLAANGARVLFTAAFVVLMGLLYPLLTRPGALPLAAGIGLGWWLIALAAVKLYPRGAALWEGHPLARAVAGLVVLVPAWACLTLLQRDPGPGYVVLLLVLIWGADSGAYFAGRRWGRHKLAPNVSPGKTWEGVAGAMLLALAIAGAGSALLGADAARPGFLLVCLLTVGFSILGDLTESMFKRVTRIKDSGGLLPGHGGILDRIDSLTAAAPIFLLGLYGLEVAT